MKMKDDPRFKSYFNLVRLGAPIPQIKMQMQAQGLDSSILDHPEADAPPMSGMVVPQENGDNNGNNNEEAPPPPPMPVSNNANNESESESSEGD